MSDFINPDPYVEKTEDIVCRDCGKTFQNTNLYDKNGFAVSFQPKYCPECNVKPKITGNNGSWGTVNIESSKVPQRNVEGLEESLQTLATSIVNARDEFRAFKKHAEHDIEEKGFEFDIFKNVTEQVIKTNKLDVDVFKSSQAEFNTKQSDFNISILKLVKEIHKSLIIGFSVLVFFMLATWGFLTYTFFKH